jgi:transposase
MTDTLFPLPTPEPPRDDAEGAAPRLERANRGQLELRATDLEGLLPQEHRARLVWDFVEGLDLAPLYRAIRAVEGQAGRPAIDPAILTALWLYATLEGVGSARALDRLCDAHDAYRWLAGGVTVNYHTLADFRVAHAEVLDAILTRSVATLMAEGLVTLTRVAQDGVRVRASAGSGSFRRRAKLQRYLEEARRQVEELRQEVDRDPAATSRRQAAARQRAVRERHERVQRALARESALAARQAQNREATTRRPPPRASSTDPDAQVMKMGDGGFRPAFNAQLASDTATQLIVGVAVTNVGSDHGELPRMLAQVRQRYGQTPTEVLADGGFADHASVVALTQARCVVYAPERRFRPPRQPRPRRQALAAAVATWRARMATAAAQAIYRERGPAECINALARNRGLQQFRVRGLAKARAIVLWFAVAHNLLRTVALRSAAATPA